MTNIKPNAWTAPGMCIGSSSHRCRVPSLPVITKCPSSVMTCLKRCVYSDSEAEWSDNLRPEELTGSWAISIEDFDSSSDEVSTIRGTRLAVPCRSASAWMLDMDPNRVFVWRCRDRFVCRDLAMGEA